MRNPHEALVAIHWNQPGISESVLFTDVSEHACAILATSAGPFARHHALERRMDAEINSRGSLASKDHDLG